MANKYLKVTGIINIIIGSLFILSIIGVLAGIPLLVSGILFEEYSKLDNERLKSKKRSIFIWSLVLLLLNLVTGVLGLIAYDKIEKGVKEVDPQTKKLDLLLKFGVLLVILSGLIFATTSWSVIPNFVKTILLLIFSVFFFILYIISSKYIKIKSTSLSYYILGCLFIIFSYISILYFKIGGIVFDKISVSVLFLLISAFSLIVSKKFDVKTLLHISFISFIVSLFLLLSNYLSIGYVSSIILLISFILSLVIKNDLNVDFDIASYLLSFYSVGYILFSAARFEVILLTVIIICGSFIKTYVTKNKTYNILFIILSYLLVSSNFASLGNSVSTIIALSGALMSVSLLELSIDLNDNVSATSIIVSDSILLIVYLTQIGSTSCSYLNTLISIFMIVPSLMSRLLSKHLKLNIVLEPVLVALLVEAIRYCLSSYIDIYRIEFMFITPFVLSIISLFKNDMSKNSYYVIIYFVILFSMINCNIISVAAFILISIILYLRNHLNKCNSYVVSYIFMMLITFVGLNIIGDEYNLLLPISLIQIGLFILYSIMNSNKVLKNITLFIIYIPYLNLRDSLQLHTNITFILDYTILIYYILLISRFIKDEKSKVNFIFITFSLIMVSLITSSNIVSGVLAGIISLVCIYIGFFKEKYDILYKSGMVLGIINIIYKLKDLWSQIPFWIYLLLVGLIIIIFVTYKQIKENRK